MTKVSGKGLVMKLVDWVDLDGYLHRAQLRDEDDSRHPEYGLPVGPPPFNLMDWEGLKREINNILVRENVSTFNELQRSSVAMPAIANICKRYIAALYRESELGNEKREL